ncbi:PASTA domain-containing protein [Pontimicrobium sp. SW4]|uniref:PASTA domain-containing protein n=1 Tax=Pontimicrobium sp. SW4 TaxID=3153519 RepID=A0AAU7BQ18_9FLAO
MSILKFVTSKEFFKQLGLAIVVLIIIGFFTLRYLKFSTNHGDFVEVPELKGKTLNVVQIEIDDHDLSMVVQDSANYNPNYPKYSVIDQQPAAGTLVKENRKIYLTLNPSGYKKVGIPNIIRRTFRQAKPTLEALGFEVGNITRVNDIGLDQVIEIRYKGEKINPGTMLEKTTKIDLVLGNGKQ